MKLALAAVGLFVALLGLGIACGPKESFCYAEGKPCSEEKARRDQESKESDASDAMDTMKLCPDPVTGELGPCPG